MPKKTTAEYKNFALKYRPENFEDIVGQDIAAVTLKSALKLGRIAHAYFLYGPRGCGKTTIARILAKALNCTGGNNKKPTSAPCGKCAQCVEIAEGSDIDVLEIDAASNTQVDKVREVIIDTVSLSPSRNRYKVFILDEVHMLSAGSFNALLKTIEEPPEHIVFILATTERHKVPATIISRCQSFRFKPIADKDIIMHLEKISTLEKLDIEKNALKLIARSAGGAMRDALTLLDRAVSYTQGKITAEIVLQMLGSLPLEIVEECVNSLINRNSEKLHSVFEEVNGQGFDIQTFLKDIRLYMSDLFYYSLKLGNSPGPKADSLIKNATPNKFAAIVRKLSKISEEIRFSDTPHILAEMGLFNLIQSEFDVAGFISRLEKLEQGVSNETPNTSPVKAENIKKKTNLTSKPLQTGTKETPPDQSDDELWKKLLISLREKHPLLSDILSNSVFRSESENVWILQLADDFSKSTIERNSAKISEILNSLSSKNIKLKFEVSAPLRNTEHGEYTNNSEENITDEKPLVENSNWQDTGIEEEMDSSVKNVLKHIEGKVIKQ